MLNKAFDKNNNLEGLIFHSDQEWQYQHQSYLQRLKNKGIKQSISKKANSMDNGMIENFFGILIKKRQISKIFTYLSTV